MAKKRNLKEHVLHKSRLTLLFLLKVFFALFSFLIVILALSFISPWTNPNFFNITISQIIYWAIALALVILLYLFFIIRILKILKFR
jgi:hypothetical protein